MIRPALAALAVTIPLSAAADPWPEGTLIAALTGTWPGDGGRHLVTLVAGAEPDGVDLVIHAPGPRGLETSLRVQNAVWGGPMYGQTPGLEPRSDTSFVITSENTAIGRGAWSAGVTVAWRGGEWVVAGFTWSFFDRVDPDALGRCDVNLLAGTWEREDGATRTSGRDGPRAFPLAALDAAFLPEVCTPPQD
jgi:hypothetical protein